MFDTLRKINERPQPFQVYTAEELWTNEHTSKKMLEYHLNESVDAASRNRAFIKRSVEWILSHFGVSTETDVADFGCGPGLYTTMLAEHGAKVTGIDFSENSIKYARQVADSKGLTIEYKVADYLEFTTERKFDLVMMIMCDFCALSPEQRRTMLSQFHSMLKENGAVLLDVYSLRAFDQKDEAAIYELNQLDNFWSPDDYYCFLNTFKYNKERVILDKYTIFEKSRMRTVYNWLQYYSESSIRKEFESNGLTIEELYSDVAGAAFSSDSSEIAVVARKS